MESIFVSCPIDPISLTISANKGISTTFNNCLLITECSQFSCFGKYLSIVQLITKQKKMNINCQYLFFIENTFTLNNTKLILFCKLKSFCFVREQIIPKTIVAIYFANNLWLRLMM